jgi:hypothetical protein
MGEVIPIVEIDETEEEAAERRRAERKGRKKSAHAERRARDLIAIDKLEEEADESYSVLETENAEASFALVAVRAPTSPIYKRFQAQVSRAKDSVERRKEATDLLARACVVYPDAQGLAVLEQESPGALNKIALHAIELADLRTEAEKKG